MPDDIVNLLSRFEQNDRRALAKLLTFVARGRHLAEIDAALAAQTARTARTARIARTARTAPVIAITGSAGVGKSTFLGRLLPVVRQAGKTVAVLACDPESPLTGGALLGDVVRMPGGVDEGIYLRSVAAPCGQGGVAQSVPLMLRLLARFGFDVLFVETVGAGQGDIAVRDLADVVVLLSQPHAGDELQYEKAGILEIADIVVIHKSDLPGAEQTAAHVRDVLARPVPVVLVSSLTGKGFQEVWRTIELTLTKRPLSSR